MLRDERDARCCKCYEAEDAGGVSLRDGYNKGEKLKPDAGFNSPTQLSEPTLRILGIKFSNLCNLSCRTCGPETSTKWFVDAKHLNWWKLNTNALNETFASNSAALEALAPALETIEGIYFAGGEPLLHEGHYAVLQYLIDHGRTDVFLTYNTNLTKLQLGKFDVLALWSKFPYVSVGASIDGYERQGELIREGLSWDKFMGNVVAARQQCPHVHIHFAITVSVFNILGLPFLCEHLRAIDFTAPAEFHFNALQEPRHYSIQILPTHMKAEAVQRLEGLAKKFSLQEQLKPVIDFMMFEDRSIEIKSFRYNTLCLDKLWSWEYRRDDF